jgi:type I restriction enzyme, R subunit
MNSENIKGKFTESELESAIIKLFEAQDYTHVLGENIHRKFEDILIEDDLREYLSWHYKDLTDTETAKIISRLQNIPAAPLYTGNKEAFRLVNEGFDLQRDDPKKVAVHINYIGNYILNPATPLF